MSYVVMLFIFIFVFFFFFKQKTAYEIVSGDWSSDVCSSDLANSPLVKTAVGGGDANWGRVVMAVGKAGEPADRDRLSIWFGGIRVARKGARDPGYAEREVAAYMKRDEI